MNLLGAKGLCACTCIHLYARFMCIDLSIYVCVYLCESMCIHIRVFVSVHMCMVSVGVLYVCGGVVCLRMCGCLCVYVSVAVMV